MNDLVKISCYVSAFNLIKNGFDTLTSMNRLTDFFDEVVVAVNTSEDHTLRWMQNYAETKDDGIVKIISTNYLYTDVAFDGKVKDAALQATTFPIKVQCDLDEYVPQSQYLLWRKYAYALITRPDIQCFMIPSVDLWGSEQTIRADNNIGLKFRMHKEGLHRGVWREAWRDGHKHIDTSKSDSCELLNSEDNLAVSSPVVPYQYLTPSTHRMLGGFPYTIHTGYLSFDQRVRVNKAIWADHWPLRSGHPERVATTKEELDTVPVIRHNLSLS